MAAFTGKVAIVTGGSAGIGRAAAVAFAREGAKVVVASRRIKEGDETVRLVREAGSDGFFIKTDVAKAADVKAMVEKTVATYGRLDYAFNNAGVVEPKPGPLVEQSEETFDQVVNINVKGVWLSMKYEIPEMLKRGGGAIVNMSSVAGVVGFPGIGIYIASKHAVIGLTKAAAVEYSKLGVRVNAVNPAAIETDMLAHVAGDDPEAKAQMAAGHPIGRIGRPEEVADAVVWLCSDKASFVTGHSLLVDGGYTAQ
jgi:NAD(P)-dependent dehydrogenase (short-subunit alcohol dehydrogenase family)